MIPLLKPNLPEWEVLSPLLKTALYDKPLNEGDTVYAFESKLSNYLNCDNIIAVSSGSAALHLALILAGVDSDDIVISTSLTAEPTNTVIKSIGASIYYCDLDPDTGWLDTESLPTEILEKSKAFIVVHYGGYVQNLQPIMNICREYNLKLIEDCAHALGSKYKAKFCGTLGDFGCFSFQAVKQITTIEGGALALKDNNLIEKAKQIRWFGLTKGVDRSKSEVSLQGYKYNYNNVLATIGLIALERYPKQLESVIEIANRFDKAISKCSSVQSLENVTETVCSYWLYLVQTSKRSELNQKFATSGISGGHLHKLNHLHPYLSTEQSLPGTEHFFNNLFHVPIGPWLSNSQVDLICNSLLSMDNV